MRKKKTTMTKKKSTAPSGNSTPPSNADMIKGEYGKYDCFYNARFPYDKEKGTPFDITPHLEIVTQDENTCAQGKQCQCMMPLSTRHRCIICAFCLHQEWGYELIETSVHKVPSTNISLVCKACVEGANLAKFIRDDELSLSPYALNKFLRPTYPTIQLVDNADSSSSSENSDASQSSSDDSTVLESEDDDAIAMEIEDSGNEKETDENKTVVVKVINTEGDDKKPDKKSKIKNQRR